MLKCINFTSQRCIGTSCQNNTSKWRQLSVGLPQGCILSPCLFYIYINDLGKDLKHTKTKMAIYADDVVIWTEAPDNKKDTVAVLERNNMETKSS